MSWWRRAISWLGAGNLTATDRAFYDALGATPTHTDEVVTASSVLGLSAAWACVNVLAGTISSLSLDTYRKEAGVKRPAPEHPLQAVLDDPNADQTPIDFLEFMSLSLELWGNAYAEVERRRDGTIISLTPVRPEIMTVERDRSGALRYRWYDDEGRHEEPEERILHIRGFGGDPLGGLSPLAWCRNTFGMAQAIERTTGATFRNGVRASGAFVAEHVLTLAQMGETEQRITEKYIGAMNAGRPLLLNAGLKWQPISFNPEEAQMLQSRGFSVEEICRVYGVPPFMVGHTEKVTSFGSGLEQQILGFQKFTLRKRLKKIEQAIRKQLMSPEDRRAGYTVSFNLEDLLRGDSKARAAFYRALLDAGVITINEVRALEGLPPIEGGDVPRMQSQNVPITVSIGHNGGPPLEDDE